VRLVEMAPGRRAARSVIVVLVLAGLWLMHGISATSDAGCHDGAMPLVAAMSHGEDAVAVPAGAPATRRESVAGAADPGMGMQQSGQLCLSGQPANPGAALIALLGLLAVARCLPVGTPTWSMASCARRRRAPPGLFGLRLLAAVCVSRT
jgi:hypothetical protein